MILLLDLNYTLVENSDDKRRPFIKQIEAEQYRRWLVELIRPHHVIMMTARPAMHREATLASISAKTAWLPQEAHFNVYGLTPPLAKERMLAEHVLPKHGGATFLAIESNPRTHAMYSRYGIRSVKIEPGERWDALPE
ncbi:MAG: hypothetical protein ACK5WQ_09300 [Alphaproteobacteria bacterium]|jgi:hypothetical protein